MVHDALEAVKLRNNFYRDSYRKLVLALVFLLIIVVGLVYTVIYLIQTEPTPTYFASTDSGRIIPLVPLNQPNLTDQALLRWASEAVVSVYSYNFINFREVLQNSEKYFTSAGWRSFMDALNKSKNLDAVKENKLVVSAMISAAPIVTRKGISGRGYYTWIVQVPVLVHFESADQHNDQSYVVQVEIRRVSTLDNIYGVGIDKFNVLMNKSG
jgi:intracellular multiplication protein IcmL